METQKKTNKKFWKPPSFEDFNVSFPNKKIKLDADDFFEDKSQEIPNEPTQPKSVSELAIHPKKIEEIRNWIKWSRSERAQILLITGPAGCGKTITLKVSAQEEGVLVKEWINPVDKTEFKAEPVFETEAYDRFNFSEAKQIDKFDDFIFRSSRYKSLFDDEKSLIILVEDIPNIFVWRPKLFHSFLEKYKSNGKSPIVFIVTDDQNLNLSSNLFPNVIRSRLNITNIKFNPVNHSSLVKNLKALCDNYSSEKISSQYLEKIIKNSGGDLRNATNELLLFLRTNMLTLNQIIKKSKKTKKENYGIGNKPLSEKDSPFDFYHVLGRILYPKLKSEAECENSNKIFLYDVQEIADKWTGSFLNILHENYLQTFTKLKDVVGGADCFSFCEKLMINQELENYVSLIGVITLMLNNTAPKKSGFNPLKKSFRLDPNNSNEDIEAGDELYGCQLRRRDFLLDVRPFLKILNMKDDVSLMKENCSESGDDEFVIEEFDD